MSKILRNVGEATAFAYANVPQTDYPAGGPTVSKQVLIGPGDAAPTIAVRYFEVPPGSATGYDQHAHEHGVVVVRGQGQVRLGDTLHPLNVGDVVYVSPNEVHQFHCVGNEPLAFMCVIDVKQER